MTRLLCPKAKKVAHQNRPTALAEMSRMARETGTRFSQLHIYRCPHEPFPHWHIGHKRPRGRR